MADVNYGQGVPTQAPDTQAPNDTQNIQPTAAAGLQKFGAGVQQTADLYNQAAVDNGFNDFQSKAIRVLYGDPSKTGPDGMPDTGFMGLQGRAAMDARPQVEAQLAQLQQETLGSLRSDAQRQQFEVASRRYRNSASIDIGSHTDQQAKTWYGDVNKSAGQNALDSIAANPTNDIAFLHAAADLTNSYVKQAQLAGAQPGDPVWNDAIDRGKKDAFKARIQAVGATDPARAIGMLQKSPSLAGTDYAPLYDNLRSRADQQTSLDAATRYYTGASGQASQAASTSLTNPSQPAYQQAATSLPGGMSAGGLARLITVESGGRDLTNQFGYKGYAQFGDPAWAQYGAGGDPHNFEDSVMAAQRYAVSNAKYLAPRLGRQPTDAELYLAHQQGPGGAAKLLTNPTAKAADLLGYRAVYNNLPQSMRGQAATMTAAQFASVWTHKFDGTTPVSGPVDASPRSDIHQAPTGPTSAGMPAPTVAPNAVDTPVPLAPQGNPLPSGDVLQATADPRANAIQSIMADDSLTPVQKQMAIGHVNQLAQDQQIADASTAAQKKAASDQAAGQYVTQMLSGNVDGLSQRIAADPNLEWQTKISLNSALLAHADESVSGAMGAYGPGFYKAFNQVMAPAGDPTRIADVSQIYQRAGQGGDLTLAGAAKLAGIMQANQKPENTAVNTTKAAMMNYAKSKLSFQQDTGPLQIKDPVGEAIFNARFVPKFEAQFDQWMKSGKDPFDFLTQDNIDKIVGGLRSPREMAMAQLSATNRGVDSSQLEAPPAPPNVDEEGWKLVTLSPPPQSDGTPWPVGNWVAAVQALHAHPTPDVIRQFNAKFQAHGISADEILSAITPQTDKPMTEWPKFEAFPTSSPSAPKPYNVVQDPRMGLTGFQ